MEGHTFPSKKSNRTTQKTTNISNNLNDTKTTPKKTAREHTLPTHHTGRTHSRSRTRASLFVARGNAPVKTSSVRVVEHEHLSLWQEETRPLRPRPCALSKAHVASNTMDCTLAKKPLGSRHDGDFLLRQVATPGSTRPLGGDLAPLLGELALGGLPCGQLAQHKLAPRRHSGKLLLVLECWQVLLSLHRRVAFQIMQRPLRRQCVSAQRWWPDEKCADSGGTGGGLGPGVDWWSLHASVSMSGANGNWAYLGRWDAHLGFPSFGVEHLVECADQVRSIAVVEPPLDVLLAQDPERCHFPPQALSCTSTCVRERSLPRLFWRNLKGSMPRLIMEEWAFKEDL